MIEVYGLVVTCSVEKVGRGAWKDRSAGWSPFPTTGTTCCRQRRIAVQSRLAREARDHHSHLLHETRREIDDHIPRAFSRSCIQDDHRNIEIREHVIEHEAIGRTGQTCDLKAVISIQGNLQPVHSRGAGKRQKQFQGGSGPLEGCTDRCRGQVADVVDGASRAGNTNRKGWRQRVCYPAEGLQARRCNRESRYNQLEEQSRR